MKLEKLLNHVRKFEDENGFADVLYLEAVKQLREIRQNPQKLDEKIAKRIIRPFLASWGRMGRNVEREDFSINDIY